MPQSFCGADPWSAADALVGFFPSHDFDSMATAGPGGPARTWRSAPRLMQIGVDHEKYAALGNPACHAAPTFLWAASVLTSRPYEPASDQPDPSQHQKQRPRLGRGTCRRVIEPS